MRVISVKMPEEMVEEIDRYAMKHGLHRSEVIRAAIIQFLITQHQRQEQIYSTNNYNEDIVVIQ